MNKSFKKKKVVVVGGGTGTHTVLRGLRSYIDKVDITAIVSMADSGGSTGRLRDEFGQLPVGDVRNALTALAADGDEYDKLMRELFSYRFNRGEGLSGHSFGNLFLTALTDILGNETKAISATSHILRVAGKVVPVTTKKAELIAVYEDGTKIIGEHEIDEPRDKYVKQRIISLSLKPRVSITKEAKKALLEADMIVLGPGDLYTSVIANFVVTGFKKTLAESSAKIVYVCNLMSKKGQTVGFNAQEHVDEIIRYIKQKPDMVLVNTENFEKKKIVEYEKEGDFPVTNNLREGNGYKVIQGDFIGKTSKTVKGDVLKRSFVRHDPDKLASSLIKFLFNS